MSLLEGFDDSEEGENEEDKSGPVNELGRRLVNDCRSVGNNASRYKLTDRKQSPSDGSSTGSVTFLASEGISSGGGLKENESEENEELGPDTSLVGVGVDTKGLEGRENDKNNSPWWSVCCSQSRWPTHNRDRARMGGGRKPPLPSSPC